MEELKIGTIIRDDYSDEDDIHRYGVVIDDFGNSVTVLHLSNKDKFLIVRYPKKALESDRVKVNSVTESNLPEVLANTIKKVFTEVHERSRRS